MSSSNRYAACATCSAASSRDYRRDSCQPLYVQDQFVDMFLGEWRDSEEYERRQEKIEMTNMDPNSYT
jgi:hypothetical protein